MEAGGRATHGAVADDAGSDKCVYGKTVLSILYFQRLEGEVSEWLKEHAWKVCIR